MIDESVRMGAELMDQMLMREIGEGLGERANQDNSVGMILEAIKRFEQEHPGVFDDLPAEPYKGYAPPPRSPSDVLDLLNGALHAIRVLSRNCSPETRSELVFAANQIDVTIRYFSYTRKKILAERPDLEERVPNEEEQADKG